jgi:multicomponent Na+:H+ antiporter subunit G
VTLLQQFLPWVGALLLALGALLLVVAAWGVLALPDALSRQHAATKAVTLAVALICTGVALVVLDSGWAWRLMLIVGFLLATLPLASHLLARAALREAGLDAQIAAAPWAGERPCTEAAPPTPTR